MLEFHSLVALKDLFQIQNLKVACLATVWGLGAGWRSVWPCSVKVLPGGTAVGLTVIESNVLRTAEFLRTYFCSPQSVFVWTYKVLSGLRSCTQKF